MSTTPNDTQLQLALAKLLPEKIELVGGFILVWKKKQRQIFDTEWEHIVRLVEENLTEDERDAFMRQIYVDLDIEGTDTGDTYPDYKLLHASFSERATAILKVRGVV